MAEIEADTAQLGRGAPDRVVCRAEEESHCLLACRAGVKRKVRPPAEVESKKETAPSRRVAVVERKRGEGSGRRAAGRAMMEGVASGRLVSGKGHALLSWLCPAYLRECSPSCRPR